MTFRKEENTPTTRCAVVPVFQEYDASSYFLSDLVSLHVFPPLLCQPQGLGLQLHQDTDSLIASIDHFGLRLIGYYRDWEQDVEQFDHTLHNNHRLTFLYFYAALLLHYQVILELSLFQISSRVTQWKSTQEKREQWRKKRRGGLNLR